MLRRVKVLSEARDVVRPVCVCMAALGVLAYAMVVKGPYQRGAVAVAMAGIAFVIVIQVWRAVRMLRDQSNIARTAAAEAEKHYVDVLRRLVKYVEAREAHAGGHSERIGRLAARIGSRLGIDADKCELLSLAGELHDVGLLAIPDGVLTQHSRFGVDEFRTVQRHSEISYEILKPLELLNGVLDGIRYHHERMNGTGYPAGLSGQDIPIEARILAVADGYDAMTHDRPYRAAIAPLEAMMELRRCTPDGYDEMCVNALADVVRLPKLEKAMAG